MSILFLDYVRSRRPFYRSDGRTYGVAGGKIFDDRLTTAQITRANARPPPLLQLANRSSDRPSFLARVNWGNDKHIIPGGPRPGAEAPSPWPQKKL